MKTKDSIKKILVILTILAFFVPVFVLAADSCQPPNYCIPNPFGEDSTIWTIIGKIIDFLFWIAMVAGTFAIIYAGYLFLFSAGDPEKVKTARHLIIYALIGVIVVFLSKGIVNLLLSVLGSKAKIP